MANPKIASTKRSELRRWTANIQGLGKVKQANVEVAPLLILAGKNNTGKSYVASSIWSLTDMWEVLGARGASLPKWWLDFCGKAWDSGGELTITTARAASMALYINQVLQTSTPEFCEELFSFGGFIGSVLSIQPKALTVGQKVTISTIKAPGNASASLRRFSMVSADGVPVFQINMSGDARDEFWQRYTFCAILEFTLFGGRYPMFDGIYLPAARTGLVLAHRALTSHGVSGLLPQGAALRLSRPLRSFVQKFAASYDKSRAHSVADWVQSQTISGTIAADINGKELFYQTLSGQRVPLYATSSMITELAPFIMILKSDNFFERLVFEEPEAHLHLAAQRTMARAIARLVNSGIQVTVTTHSDTFLQQINNLIHLQTHPNKKNLLKELGYTEEDTIDPRLTKAYEFIETEEGTTEVEEATVSEGGYAINSINSVLIELSHETLSLQEQK